MHASHAALAIALAAATLGTQAQAQSYTFTALTGFNGDNTVAVGISNTGEIIGLDNHAGSASQAVTWTTSGSITAMSLLPGTTGATPESINDHGQIVGVSFAANGAREATLWTNGTPTALTPPDGSTSTTAVAINNDGQVYGYAATVNVPTATDTVSTVLWSPSGVPIVQSTGPYSAAPTKSCTLFASACGQNSFGEQVGSGGVNAGALAGHAIFRYSVVSPSLDLNTLVSPDVNASGWVLEHAFSINNAGQIVGEALNTVTGATEGYLLTPTSVPEAPVSAMFMLGLGSMGWMLRRRKAQG
jgi:probable HAF family extracellular repeat protein